MIIHFRHVRYASDYDPRMKTGDALADLRVRVVGVPQHIETIQNYKWNQPSLPRGHRGMPPTRVFVHCAGSF